MEGIELEQAVDILLRRSKKIGREEVSLLEALGRATSDEMRAAFDNPPFDRSPLDGYAIIAADTETATEESPVRLRIIGEECAGEFFEGEVRPGEALRIMTGSAMPKGTDAVVRQEDVRIEGDILHIPYGLRHHENYCFRGEDICQGTVLVQAGEILRPAQLAVLASQGFARVHVCKRPRVVLASTGDELIPPGAGLAPGKIYNSNLYLLAGRLKELGCEVRICGILSDDAGHGAEVLREYAEEAELILTTGGVSVGKKDIMHEVVKLLGAEQLFWRVSMKPGYPVLAYQVGGALGLALSGNPFAAYASFELIARPLLARLSGRRDIFLQRRKGMLEDAFPKVSNGRRFVRAYYEDGRVRLPEQHSSGSIFSATGCNALVDIPPGSGKLAVGAEVEVVLL